MPLYLDTRGEADLGIAICARCSVKYPRTRLVSDPNSPGLKVCTDGCLDEFDPYRLPAREPDKITMEWTRPDTSVAVYNNPPAAQTTASPGYGLINDGTFLMLTDATGWPTTSLFLPPGSFFSNGLFVCVVPGYALASPFFPIVFGLINATTLLNMGGSPLSLPTVQPPSGTLILWNNGGFVCIA